MSLNNELLEILLSFVITALPHYNLDSVPLPIVVERPHTFFVENVCGGIEEKCRNVEGWYNNTGIIYIDKELSKDLVDEVVVHEATHYAQDLSGKYDNDSCKDSIYRELEAFRVQNKYMLEKKGKFLFPNRNLRIICKKMKPKKQIEEEIEE